HLAKAISGNRKGPVLRKLTSKAISKSLRILFSSFGGLDDFRNGDFALGTNRADEWKIERQHLSCDRRFEKHVAIDEQNVCVLGAKKAMAKVIALGRDIRRRRSEELTCNPVRLEIRNRCRNRVGALSLEIPVIGRGYENAVCHGVQLIE